MKTFFEWAKENIVFETSPKKIKVMDDENQENYCSHCGGSLEELGALGCLMHSRCRQCGAMTSLPIEGCG